ncbi:hypothetical protein [Prescottella equi]|uniref:hypothetical protein n=1 Tax=Rhodococcus hoagii TaxID=43767 RepID=UPI0007CD7DE5|nr:hypothetical protein [Prescottella equi]WJJ10836.1 hypothetical protein P9990_19985 [Prescottella equi]
MIDTSKMSDAEIEAYAREAIASSGAPDEDPSPLISALKNAVAREKALEDPFWRALTNKEADRMKEAEGE